MSGFTAQDLRWAAERISDHAATVSEQLCDADAKLGDGDLGITVAAGWAEITQAELPDDVGLALLECAKCFQRASSSSFGTLVATGFMSAAKTCKGRQEVPYAEIPELIAGACAAMMARGKGQLGDKSVLDVLEACRRAAADQTSPGALLDAAHDAAAETVSRFTELPNKLGRARMFGDKSVGLPDPGQLAALEMLRGLRQD